jgi:hypothetical protein
MATLFLLRVFARSLRARACARFTSDRSTPSLHAR